VSGSIFTIYRITLPTGEGYIGCTSKTLQERWTAHTNGAWGGMGRGDRPPTGCRIADAIKYYGPNNCTIEALASAVGLANASECETLLIAQHDTYKPNGFNRHSRSNYRNQHLRWNTRRAPISAGVTRDIIWVSDKACRSWPPHPNAQAA